MLPRLARARSLAALARAAKGGDRWAPATSAFAVPSAAAPLGAAWTCAGPSRGFAAWTGGSDEEAAAADAASAAAAVPGDTLQAAADAIGEWRVTAVGGAGSGSADPCLPSAGAAAFDPAAAVTAASAAETAALIAAKTDTWIFNSSFQTLLEAVHTSTGLPWVTAIAATTVAARTLLLPVVAKQMRNTHSMSLARPEMLELQEWFKRESAAAGAGPALAAEYQARLAAVWQKHDCHPMKSIGSLLLQAPLFIGFFSALRSMAAAGVPSLASGGALWFPDLTAADATYGLPILSSSIFLLTVELGAADGMQGQDPGVLSKMKMFMRALAVAMVPLTASMPAGVFVYWATSNAYSLAQSVAFKAAPVRALFGLQPLGVGAAKAAAPSASAAATSPAALAAAVAGKPVATFATRPGGGGRRRRGGGPRAAR